MLHWFLILFLFCVYCEKKNHLAKVLLPDCKSGNSDRAKYASATGGWNEHVRDQGPLSRATPSLPWFSFLLGISSLLFADFNGFFIFLKNAYLTNLYVDVKNVRLLCKTQVHASQRH